MNVVRASVGAGAFAGLVLACGDLAFGLGGALAAGAGGAAALGALTVLFLDGLAGLLVGLLAAPILAAWSDRAGRDRAASAIRELARSFVRPVPPDVEARRVGWLAAGVIAAAGAAVTLVELGAAVLPRVQRDAAPASAYAAGGIALVLVWTSLVPALARLLSAALARAGRFVCLRNVVAAGLACAVAIALLFRAPLVAFLQAVDVRPAVLALLFCVAFAWGLALVHAPDAAPAADPDAAPAARAGRLRRAVLAATSWRGLVVSAVALALLALATFGPASHAIGAIRVYRVGTPIARLLADGAAAALDSDGDGYSAFLGDGDCAPSDPRRNPGAREIPKNGRDDDCFDGDLAKHEDPFPVPPPAPRPPAVRDDLSYVIVLVDALRPDHLGCYGYGRPTSPNIDAFARGASRFQRAYSAAPYTWASIPTILTGKLASMLPRGILKKKGMIAPADRTLAELLSEKGFRTAIVTDSDGIISRTGADRGFQKKRVVNDDAGEVTEAAISFLDDFGGDRFFLWVDYLAPHAWYVRHPGVPSFGGTPMDMYDHEIRHVDDAFGRLLERLDRPDLRDRVVIVFTADHGEAFGEHGSHYHGQNLHEENVRVPLLVRVPGLEPRVLDEPVSLLDVLPTLLNLAGIEPPGEARGHDLTGALATGTQPPGRHVFSESKFEGGDRSYQCAVTTRTHKLIEQTKTRTLLLYDLAKDPGEKRDLSADEPDLLHRLRRASKHFQSLGK